jgi:hypothetical protein
MTAIDSTTAAFAQPGTLWRLSGPNISVISLPFTTIFGITFDHTSLDIFVATAEGLFYISNSSSEATRVPQIGFPVLTVTVSSTGVLVARYNTQLYTL